jgi:Fe-S-cluster containining protein
MAIDAITAAWRAIEGRYPAYSLAVPGAPAFHCQPDLCDAHCCRAFTVNLGTSEVERMQSTSGLAPSRFLECEDGEPLALPLAQPYILARKDNHCGLLDDNRGCSQYAGRPNACRLYPHFLLFVDAASGRPVHGDIAAIRASISQLRAGEPLEPLVPILVRHIECPGFTGAPMSAGDWLALLEETFELQYPHYA